MSEPTENPEPFIGYTDADLRTALEHRDRVESIRGVTKNIIVLIALFIVIFNFFDKRSSETSARQERADLRTQLATVQAKLAENDADAAAQLNCARRFQDLVDETFTDTVITIGELVVLITQVEPGPERVAAVGAKVEQLKASTVAARKAVDDKSNWNDALNPLPCPI